MDEGRDGCVDTSRREKRVAELYEDDLLETYRGCARNRDDGLRSRMRANGRCGDVHAVANPDRGERGARMVWVCERSVRTKRDGAARREDGDVEAVCARHAREHSNLAGATGARCPRGRKAWMKVMREVARDEFRLPATCVV